VRRAGPVGLYALVALGLAVTRALAMPPHDPSTVAFDAYGDTVWFESPAIKVGNRYMVEGLHGGSWSTPMAKLLTAWARTRGTPVLIYMSERDPSPPVAEIVERALQLPRLGLRGAISSDGWQITTMESGRYDNFEGRPLDGWAIDFRPDDERMVRLVLVVIGLEQTTVDSLPDRAETRSIHHVRPFEVPIPDRLRTARVVGEYHADLKQGRIERMGHP